MGYDLVLRPVSVAQRNKPSTCCPPMSNPSTSSLTAWPDGFRQWDNRMAAQHLPRDLVRPSCGLKNSLKRWRRKQTQNPNSIRLRLQQRKPHSWSFWKRQESGSKTYKIQSMMHIAHLWWWWHVFWKTWVQFWQNWEMFESKTLKSQFNLRFFAVVSVSVLKF